MIRPVEDLLLLALSRFQLVKTNRTLLRMIISIISGATDILPIIVSINIDYWKHTIQKKSDNRSKIFSYIFLFHSSRSVTAKQDLVNCGAVRFSKYVCIYLGSGICAEDKEN